MSFSAGYAMCALSWCHYTVLHNYILYLVIGALTITVLWTRQRFNDLREQYTELSEVLDELKVVHKSRGERGVEEAVDGGDDEEESACTCADGAGDKGVEVVPDTLKEAVKEEEVEDEEVKDEEVQEEVKDEEVQEEAEDEEVQEEAVKKEEVKDQEVKEEVATEQEVSAT